MPADAREGRKRHWGSSGRTVKCHRRDLVDHLSRADRQGTFSSGVQPSKLLKVAMAGDNSSMENGPSAEVMLQKVYQHSVPRLGAPNTSRNGPWRVIGLVYALWHLDRHGVCAGERGPDFSSAVVVIVVDGVAEALGVVVTLVVGACVTDAGNEQLTFAEAKPTTIASRARRGLVLMFIEYSCCPPTVGTPDERSRRGQCPSG